MSGATLNHRTSLVPFCLRGLSVLRIGEEENKEGRKWILFLVRAADVSSKCQFPILEHGKRLSHWRTRGALPLESHQLIIQKGQGPVNSIDPPAARFEPQFYKETDFHYELTIDDLENEENDWAVDFIQQKKILIKQLKLTFSLI